MTEEKDFRVFLQNKKIPICTLDQKWHKLFALKGKPENITACEQELNEYLKKQGQINNEIKDLKKLKAKLMGNIVQNMEGTHAENQGQISSKKLDEDKRLIDEINDKIASCEDALLDLPREIGRINKELMLLTVAYCYEKLRINVAEVREISDWITQVRIDLKKNIIKKQNREVNSRQIYAYMHDLFGAEMMDVFDLDNGDIDLSVLEPPKKKTETTEPAKDDEKQQSDGQKQDASDGNVIEKDGSEPESLRKENFETD